MRIGIAVGEIAGSSGNPNDIVDEIVAAENDGFSAVWIAQLFGADSLTVYALAASRTSKIELGTAVVPIFTRHPLSMAAQALTVQAVAGGRLTLGLGLSHKPVVEGMFGIGFEKPAKRMREYLQILRQVFDNGNAALQGEFYRVAAPVGVPGGGPVPVLSAALGPAMLKAAGEFADGTITWMTGKKTLETHTVPAIRQAASDAGRPEPRIAAGVPVVVTDDVGAARERASAVFAMYGGLPSYRAMLDREGIQGPADALVAGDEATVAAELQGYLDAGATEIEVVMMPIGADKEEREASARRTREHLASLLG